MTGGRPSGGDCYELYRGAGLGIKLLYDILRPGIDPLSEDNAVIIAPGPFTGTTLPCTSRTSRVAIMSKSPLTGAIGMSMCGGYFPSELKYSGWDAIIITGKASKPTLLFVTKQGVRFLDASDFYEALLQLTANNLLKKS
ncbi:MAG: aldehyde ferredoxin oxidoreductase N-terminal domain-containing protein [Nitrososphaerota archaeon]